MIRSRVGDSMIQSRDPGPLPGPVIENRDRDNRDRHHLQVNKYHGAASLVEAIKTALELGSTRGQGLGVHWHGIQLWHDCLVFYLFLVSLEPNSAQPIA
jgi:hypothetical protein